MMKTVCVIALAAVVAGCDWQRVKTVANGTVSVICAGTTADARAEIRKKQNLPTDICGDTQQQGEQ